MVCSRIINKIITNSFSGVIAMYLSCRRKQICEIRRNRTVGNIKHYKGVYFEIELVNRKISLNRGIKLFTWLSYIFRFTS